MSTQEALRTLGEPAHLPFGRFFGKVTRERRLPGFRLARYTPTVPRREVRRHLHEEAHYVFVLRGPYETQARAAPDGSAPRIVYSPPGIAHRDCFAGEDLSRAAFATLSVAAHAMAGVESEVAMPAEPVCLPAAALALVRRLLDEALSTGSGDDLTDCVAEGLCVELLVRTGAERDRAPSGAPVWLERARELLRETSLGDGPRSVGQIAQTLGIHPVHLARSFRRHFGRSPGEYLRRCRLERARRLLCRSSAGLADVAAASGFADQSHFTHSFRRAFGLSPGAFRRSRGVPPAAATPPASAPEGSGGGPS